MPTDVDRELRRRGGVLGWRTIRLRDGRHARVAVTREPGPRGGRTVIVRTVRRDNAKR